MSCPAVVASGPVLAPTGDAGEDQSGVDGRAVVGPDAEPFAGARPEAVQQHVGLGRQPSSTSGSALTSRSTTRLPRCIRSTSSAGICSGLLPPSLRSPGSGLRTRTTSAPRSARIIPACGPGPMPPSSMTFTPARGPVFATRGETTHCLRIDGRYSESLGALDESPTDEPSPDLSRPVGPAGDDATDNDPDDPSSAAPAGPIERPP